MSFADPIRLLLLVLVVAIAVVYAAIQARRGTYALRISDASLLDSIAPQRPGWRRHAVAATFLAAIAALIAALAGPQRDERVPRERAFVVLTIDTSLSMGATDVEPTRIDAAKTAALEFIKNAPDSIDIGLVSFDMTPTVQVPPTQDRDTVSRAVEALQLDEATATGDAIFASLETLRATIEAGERLGESSPVDPDDVPDDAEAFVVDGAAVIVLLSDGTPTIPSPESAALARVAEAIGEANEVGVAVSTVAFGTAQGIVSIPDPNAPDTSLNVEVPVDEPTLRGIAEETGGTFFAADSADALADVYEDIGSAVGYDVEQRDISDWFTTLALLLALLTAALSLWWFQRLP